MSPTPQANSSLLDIYKRHNGIEDVNKYRPGGYHPVHLDDTFESGRYRVVHKLGYGFSSTVWLAKDAVAHRYVSLKILTADPPRASGSSEFSICQLLQQADQTSDYVVQILDTFVLAGPNGTHQCVVTEVLGPSLACDLDDIYDDESFPVPIAKRISLQIAEGLAYLHRLRVVHGDFTPHNVLFYSREVASWKSPDDPFTDLDRPDTVPVTFSDPARATEPVQSTNVPRYVVHPAMRDSLLESCLASPSDVHVRICDFSESFVYDPAHPQVIKLGTARTSAAPEVWFEDVPSPASDVWALAVLIHELLGGAVYPFPARYGLVRTILCEMVLVLGKFPEPWWSKWPERSKYFDEEGNYVGDRNFVDKYPPRRLVKISRLSEEDYNTFSKLFSEMVRYQPSERLTAEEVVERLKTFM